jgi:hypothetical protein
MERFYWEYGREHVGETEVDTYDMDGDDYQMAVDVEVDGYLICDRHGAGGACVAVAFTADLAEQIVRALNAESVS